MLERKFTANSHQRVHKLSKGIYRVESKRIVQIPATRSRGFFTEFFASRNLTQKNFNGITFSHYIERGNSNEYTTGSDIARNTKRRARVPGRSLYWGVSSPETGFYRVLYQ